MKTARSLIFTLLLSINFYAHASDLNYIIIDARTPQEYQTQHLENARNIDLLNSNTFEQEILKLDKNKSYKIYCRSGNRSGQAARFMQNHGFKNVENIGGIEQARKNLKLKCVGNC